MSVGLVMRATRVVYILLFIILNSRTPFNQPLKFFTPKVSTRPSSAIRYVPKEPHRQGPDYTPSAVWKAPATPRRSHTAIDRGNQFVDMEGLSQDFADAAFVDVVELFVIDDSGRQQDRKNGVK